MAYNRWKLIDKIDVAIKTEPNYRGFTGYIVEHGDEEALKKAKDWATIRGYNREKQQYFVEHEPKVYTFDNKGFTARIMESAGGSYQGGRLSFWQCEIEKDGIKFTIGVNDAILADLIKSSDISNGQVKQKVMFARQSGQPGLIHEGMESYKDAQSDMKHKAEMKSAKKTSKWEIGGVYQTLTQTDICLGEVWDLYEEVQEQTTSSYSWYNHTRTTLRKREKPVKVLAWKHIYNFQNNGEIPKDFGTVLKDEIKDRDYIYFDTGKPPARAKTAQLEIRESDMVLLDKMLLLKQDYVNYDDIKIRGRYVREIK